VTVSSAERSRFDAQISFAGSWSRKRERYVEALLEAGFALRVWGAQWHHAGRRLSRRGVLQCREARAEDFSRVCRASGLVLNLLTEENYDSSNLRVFEVGACGGTLFSERSERIVATLGPHSEAFLFQDPSQAVERARILLEDAPQRAGWAGELHHRLTCQGRNTFLARTREIIERTQLQCRSFTA
jgi:spore maturation protein CgeB